MVAGTPHPGGTGPDSCHIRVRFDSPPIVFDYQDDRAVAARFSAAVTKAGARVTIDSDLRDNLPPLPCRRLWT